MSVPVGSARLIPSANLAQGISLAEGDTGYLMFLMILINLFTV